MIIFAEEPIPDMSAQEMKQVLSSITSINELVDLYVLVHNKFWFIEDDLYDFEEGTKEYENKCAEIDEWGNLMNDLSNRVMQIAAEERLLMEQPDVGLVKQLEAFMDKYGYLDGNGWWIKKDQIANHNSAER